MIRLRDCLKTFGVSMISFGFALSICLLNVDAKPSNPCPLAGTDHVHYADSTRCALANINARTQRASSPCARRARNSVVQRTAESFSSYFPASFGGSSQSSVLPERERQVNRNRVAPNLNTALQSNTRLVNVSRFRKI